MKKFDATKIRKIYEDNLKFWKRKEFKDFNYIEIQLPSSAKFVFGLIIATFVGLVTYAVIKNKKRLIDIDWKGIKMNTLIMVLFVVAQFWISGIVWLAWYFNLC